MKKIKPEGILNVLTYASDNGGCGYIRSILPNISMTSWRYKKMRFNFDTLPIFVQDPSFYKSYSFVKFQRSATKNQLLLMKHFIKNIKNQSQTGIVYESDDNLFNIPESNFAHQYYKQNKPYIEEMLSIVDGITVSTGYLKKCYNKYNKNISVVPNKLCKSLWGNVKTRDNFENVDKKPKIVYPGSQNHFATVEGTTGGDIGPVLMDYIKKTTDKYEWIFIGGMPNELEDLKKQGKITFHSWVNILDYPSFIKNLDADIAIAPLEINDFNRSKSNIKRLEYVVCGLPAVFTNIEPYKNAAVTAETEEFFIDRLEWLVYNPDIRYKMWKKEYDSLKRKLYFEDSRLQWLNENLKLFDLEIK